MEDGFDGGEGAGVGHGKGGLGGFACGGFEVFGSGDGEVGGVGGDGGVVVPGAEGGDELRDDGEEIAVDGEVGSGVVEPKGFGADIHLDELCGGVPFGGVPEVEDPIQAGAEEEDDVGFGEGGATRAGGVKGVGVWDDAFAHGGGEEGEAGIGDEVADGRFGTGVGCAFADDYEWGLCGFEELGDLEEDGLLCAWFWPLWYNLGGLHIFCIFNGALDDVCRQVNEAGAWSAIPRGSIGVLYDAGDGFERWRADRKLSMRRQKGDGVEFLECSAVDEVGLRRASEQEHGEGIDA